MCLIAGCGIVDLKVFYSDKKKVVGIDISKTALKEGSRFGAVVLADVTHLPFRDGSFDSVCAFDVFEHVPKKRLMMTELKNVLKNGGKIFLSVPIAVGKFNGDKRQPFDEAPHLISFVSLVKDDYQILLIRGFWGHNPLNHLPHKFLCLILPIFRYLPYALIGSRYVSLVAVKS
jgi:SAM-dependent methyltransferase